MGFIEECKDSDAIYDIYIRDLGAHTWGSTQYEAGGSSFIKIRNNFDNMSDYCSDSNELLWLTVAHEFFHAIQNTYISSTSETIIISFSLAFFNPFIIQFL